MKRKDYVRNWHLYWVTSDGIEDCFVVARSTQSARRIECQECGWHHSEVMATKVLTIPRRMELTYFRKRRATANESPWPGYADDWLLKKLGALTRERDGLLETLLDGVVYANGPDGPVAPRPIGRRALRELKNDPVLSKYGKEDSWTENEQLLFMMMGLCLARCQEIEHLIAHSFIFAVSEKERRQYRTINELRRGWKRKTLGALIRIIEEGYEIEPTVHDALVGFLEMRNRLVHSLTTDNRTDIGTRWGQDEMVAYLALFEIFTRPVRKAFQASLYASIQFGTIYLQKDHDRAMSLTKKQLKEAALFASFFKPRVAKDA